VNLSFDYFSGVGLHLALPETEELIVFNVNDFCFDNSKSDAIAGFFPNVTENVKICYHY
jgi:hypothetical protein